MTGVRIVAGYTLRESLRRRVFSIVIGLTGVVLGLYAFGTAEAFEDVSRFGSDTPLIDARELAGSTLLGLSMFVTLFLGAVLAAFLTLGAVRGDAESGLLQPLAVRPVSRSALLLGRFLAAASVAALYAIAVHLIAVLITGLIGDWWPQRLIGPGLELAGAVVIVAGISLLGSVFLTATANGIAVFMLFGAGLLAGLLGEVADALSSATLERISQVATWVLPFEALYQKALSGLPGGGDENTQIVVELGPFGGAEPASAWLWLWAIGYLVLLGALASALFARRDL